MEPDNRLLHPLPGSQKRMENAIINVITKIDTSAMMKRRSATRSNFSEWLSFFALMERKESRLLAIRRRVATPVNSSISVTEL
jgi:hypothetical protein